MSNFLVGTNTADVQLDKFSGNASTVAFTLSVASSTFSALVRISGVVQTPVDDFNISGTAITFTSAPPIGTNNIVVTYTKAAQIGVPNDASVSASKLASNAVTTAKILDANITTSKILDANITTSKLQDNAVSLAKLAGGTANKLMGFDGSGDPAEVDAPVALAGTQYFMVHLGSVQVLTTTTNVKVEFDTVISDTEGDFDTTTNHRFDFDADSAGLWIIAHKIYIQNVGANTGTFLFKNATNLDTQYMNLGAQSNAIQGVYMGTFADGDYIYSKAYQQSGSNKNILSGQNGTSFWGVRIA